MRLRVSPETPLAAAHSASQMQELVFWVNSLEDVPSGILVTDFDDFIDGRVLCELVSAARVRVGRAAVSMKAFCPGPVACRALQPTRPRKPEVSHLNDTFVSHTGAGSGGVTSSAVCFTA